MAKIPPPNDPTLEAVDRIVVEKQEKENRPYLGMSGIGYPCLRRHWYSFRWCVRNRFDAATLYRFADGHESEEIMAERLSQVPGIELQVIDSSTGYQFGFNDIGGHFKGHCDGLIKGLIQSPKTPHIWEHKCVNEAKFKKLGKLAEDLGEKQALSEWDDTYYIQAQLYMHYAGIDRHYLTCSTPGTRQTTSVRTEPDKDTAEKWIKAARRVIESQEPLEKISDKPTYYLCKHCSASGVCHGGDLPEVNCRTCLHSTPEMDGDGRWTCARLKCDISTEVQRKSSQCPHHRYIPALVSFAEPTDASQQENWVEYTDRGGNTFRNGGNGLSSIDMRAKKNACQ